jgi:adenine-specific DNA-methyltransferase
VRYQDIAPTTRALLRQDGFDGAATCTSSSSRNACITWPRGRTDLHHPRDFLKSTSARRLNRWLHERGTITHAIELGDARVFADALPNCLIWRYELGNLSHNTAWAQIQGDDVAHGLDHPHWQYRHFSECAGHLLFSRGEYALSLADVASVRVGAVSGADEIYVSDRDGNRDFVSSGTIASGQTRRMIWCEPGEPPRPCCPTASACWPDASAASTTPTGGNGAGATPEQCAAGLCEHQDPPAQPFFIHPCLNFDGAVLGSSHAGRVQTWPPSAMR